MRPLPVPDTRSSPNPLIETSLLPFVTEEKVSSRRVWSRSPVVEDLSNNFVSDDPKRGSQRLSHSDRMGS